MRRQASGVEYEQAAEEVGAQRGSGRAGRRRAAHAASPRRRASSAAAASTARRTRHRRARADRPTAEIGNERAPRIATASAPASRTSFHAATTSSDAPRTPASQSSAIARLWSASPTTKTTSAIRGSALRSRDRHEREAEVDDAHRAREERRRSPLPRRWFSRAQLLPARSYARPAAPSGSQCTSGSLVCTSIGNQRFGVVRNTRRPTRNASATNDRCRSTSPTCSITAFEKTTSNAPSGNGSAHASPWTYATSG